MVFNEEFRSWSRKLQPFLLERPDIVFQQYIDPRRRRPGAFPMASECHFLSLAHL